MKVASLLKRSRAPAPPVPPLLDRTAFDTFDAYKAYMQERRRAKERLREANRPHRNRSGRDQSNRDQSGRDQTGRARPSRDRAREAARAEASRRINHQVAVHVGRKRMYSMVPLPVPVHAPLLPQPCAVVMTHPVPPAPPLPNTHQVIRTAALRNYRRSAWLIQTCFAFVRARQLSGTALAVSTIHVGMTSAMGVVNLLFHSPNCRQQATYSTFCSLQLTEET